MSSRCWFTANRRREAQHVTNTMTALVYKCHIDTRAPFLDACSCLTHGLLTFVSEQPSSRLTWKKRFAAADRRGRIRRRHKDVRFNWFGWLQFNRSDCAGSEKDSTCSGELRNWRYGRCLQLYRWDLSRSNVPFVRCASLSARACVNSQMRLKWRGFCLGDFGLCHSLIARVIPITARFISSLPWAPSSNQSNKAQTLITYIWVK